MREAPPLVILILGGVAERLDCPRDASPLALAHTPHLDRLAAEGRVFSVALIGREGEAHTAAPLLSILGLDPARNETARASYIGALTGEVLAAEECFASADFCALFRNMVADTEPGPFHAAEIDTLIRAASDAVRRAGFRLLRGAGASHLAIAPRASIDPDTPPPALLVGKQLTIFEPGVQQHGFAHRLAREALDGHEVNEVRRDLGGNGADLVWIWGPGGPVRLTLDQDAHCSALGSDLVWRGVCKAAGLRLRSPNARTPAQLARALKAALKRDRVCHVHARRGIRDALSRRLGARTDGLAELDRHLVGPLAGVVAGAGGRLLVLPDTARDTATGRPLAGPVPALLWGRDVRTLSVHPFHEAGAAAAGDPLAPGHGLLAYVRHL